MNKRIRITAWITILCWLAAALCGCTRREPDMLDEIVWPEGYETEADMTGGTKDAAAQASDGAKDAAAQAADGAERGGPASGHEAQADRESQASEEDVASAASDCYVYICGAVQKAGVYRMEPGERIFAAVEKAGGFAPEACKEYVNLAIPVTDGLRIWIPTTEEAEKEGWPERQIPGGNENAGLTYPQAGAGAQKGSEAGDGLVDINTASAEQLMSLTGIGAAKAQAIIAYRSEHGSFSKKEDIMKVAGIKQSGYDKIKDQITVNQG